MCHDNFDTNFDILQLAYICVNLSLIMYLLSVVKHCGQPQLFLNSAI